MLKLKQLISICFFCTVWSIASAQSYRLAKSKGVWFPAVQKSVSYQRAQYFGYKMDQQKQMYSNMGRFMELIHQIPFLNPPNGYEIGLYAALCENGGDPKQPIPGKSGMIIREYFTRGDNPKIERAAEGPSINVYFNDISLLANKIGTGEDGYFEEPEIIDSISGFPVYRQGLVVVTKIDKPLFVPVSVAKVIEISIKQKEKDLEEVKKSFNKGSTYKQWLAKKDATIKAVNEGLAYLAKTDPEKAKTNKEKFEREMKKTDSTMKAEEAGNLLEQQRMVAKYEDDVQKEKQKLASLSAEQKQAPATTNRGKKLVVPNKDFLKASLPVYAIQLALIDLFRYKIEEKGSSGGLSMDAIREIRKTINLKKLLTGLQ
ncbi:hypothetical protein [Pedobacter foliorum]|uniref:hypothetical protein n=1 Tax=Pedobacter foliorum TaxID=2739058 RepID=UPI001562EC8A|nr:hypothetical protein [Pedobacter foliorum]NRF39120.1 hypothetical protein [Pedobacter foliorum]